MTRRIFLTGAAGFIGSHLAHALRARGDTVLGYDNFNSYYDPTLKRARVAHFGHQVIKGDVADKKFLFSTLETFRPTHIVHLAAQAGVRYSLNNPEAYIHSNIDGFLNILEACRAHSLPLVYASSSSVYGTNTKLPFSIDDPTDHPSNLYGATKKSNELMAYAYHHCFGIPTVGLRFFTVYGPWGRPDMAYFKFSDAILNERTIELYNGGNMERDFTYIDDIVAGTIATLDLKEGCHLFNLGNSDPLPVTLLLSTLEKLLNKKAKIETLPLQTGEVLSTFADTTHSRNILNYNPRTRLAEGLAKFTDWFLESSLA
jgi:UDP-glucuronate 4-epimerase